MYIQCSQSSLKQLSTKTNPLRTFLLFQKRILFQAYCKINKILNSVWCGLIKGQGFSFKFLMVGDVDVQSRHLFMLSLCSIGVSVCWWRACWCHRGLTRSACV